MGTLGIRAEHTQNSPPGLIGAPRLLKVTPGGFPSAQEDCAVAGHAELQHSLPTGQVRACAI